MMDCKFSFNRDHSSVKIFIFISLFLLFACKNEVKEKPLANTTIYKDTLMVTKEEENDWFDPDNVPNEVSTPITMNNDFSFDNLKKAKSILVKNIRQFKHLSPKEGEWNSFSFSYLKQSNIINYGKVDLYQIKLNWDTTPTGWYHEYVLVHNLQRAEIAVFYITELHLVKIQSKAADYFIAGTLTPRRIGYFAVYQYEKGKFYNKFYPEIENRLPVYNDEAAFTKFEPLHLKFKNQDINQDGWLDIIFSGKVIVPNFNNIRDYPGIIDQKGRKIYTIKMTYLWNNNNKSWILPEDFKRLYKIIHS